MQTQTKTTLKRDKRHISIHVLIPMWVTSITNCMKNRHSCSHKIQTYTLISSMASCNSKQETTTNPPTTP